MWLRWDPFESNSEGKQRQIAWSFHQFIKCYLALPTTSHSIPPPMLECTLKN